MVESHPARRRFSRQYDEYHIPVLVLKQPAAAPAVSWADRDRLGPTARILKTSRRLRWRALGFARTLRGRSCNVVALRCGRGPVAWDYWRERCRQFAEARLRLFGIRFIGADKTLDAFVSARSRSPIGIDLANTGDRGFRPVWASNRRLAWPSSSSTRGPEPRLERAAYRAPGLQSLSRVTSETTCGPLSAPVPPLIPCRWVVRCVLKNADRSRPMAGREHDPEVVLCYRRWRRVAPGDRG